MTDFEMRPKPTEEQIETARLFLEQHRPDYKGQCPTLTCAVGAHAVQWPCKRWNWATETLQDAGFLVEEISIPAA